VDCESANSSNVRRMDRPAHRVFQKPWQFEVDRSRDSTVLNDNRFLLQPFQPRNTAWRDIKGRKTKPPTGRPLAEPSTSSQRFFHTNERAFQYKLVDRPI
jgi:hypothetical protein